MGYDSVEAGDGFRFMFVVPKLWLERTILLMCSIRRRIRSLLGLVCMRCRRDLVPHL
jgi:hypothetical protein